MPALGWFLVSVLPAVIFFVALVQLLFYNGVLQWFIGKFATFFFWSMRVSGAEAVVAAASPFIGQGESAMLIKRESELQYSITSTDLADISLWASFCLASHQS